MRRSRGESSPGSLQENKCFTADSTTSDHLGFAHVQFCSFCAYDFSNISVFTQQIECVVMEDVVFKVTAL